MSSLLVIQVGGGKRDGEKMYILKYESNRYYYNTCHLCTIWQIDVHTILCFVNHILVKNEYIKHEEILNLRSVVLRKAGGGTCFFNFPKVSNPTREWFFRSAVKGVLLKIAYSPKGRIISAKWYLSVHAWQPDLNCMISITFTFILILFL